TAKSYYIYVGGTAPTTYEYTVTGLVGEEKLTAEPSGTCTPDVLKVGTYPITIAGAAVTTPANYTITYVPGSLNVMYYIDEPRTAVSSGSEIYTGDLQRLAAQNKDFTVTGDNGAALKFNPEALKELAKNGGKITVTISDAGDRLSEAQKKIAGDRPVFDLTVMCGKTVISDFGGGSVQVSLPYTLKDGEDPDLVCVWNLAEDGTLTGVSGRYDPISKTIVFTTAHFSQYVVGKWVNHFADVAESAWYYGSVAKMNALGLMNGTDAKTFSASTKATRSMLLSMLYRMAGSPEAIPASGAWYGRALSWALGSGISDGTNPERDISREELVTILWRYAGSPKTGGNISRFADAASVAGYAKDAMAWAVESGLLIGSEGKLLPKGSAYRAQVAAVLSRYIDTLAK
ncbi:MAG: S-layer homology domain-containing protein, partial [Oscillospiraceae bacterium]